MKFHFVSTLQASPWGGSEELWSRTAVQLAQSGHEVTASVRHWPSDLRSGRLDGLLTSGVDLRAWGKPPTPPQRIWHLGRRVFGEVIGRPYRGVVDYKINNADLIILSSTGNDFPFDGVQQCLARGTPYVLVIQSVSESYWPPDTEVLKWQHIYHDAKAAFFVSHANLESTELQLGFRGRHFRVISNPYQVSRSVSFSWPSRGDHMDIAFVGRLEPQHKGLDLLFRALAQPVWKNRNLRVNVYGAGRSQTGVRRMAELLGLENLVVFHGLTTDIEAVWRTNQMLVLPSRHEGLPLALIEAMMCGRPCLVTNVSGNPEHVIDGETGFIAAGATAESVSQTLERAWQARDRWKEMGQKAYAHIRQRIAVDPVACFAESLVQIASGSTQKAKQFTTAERCNAQTI